MAKDFMFKGVICKVNQGCQETNMRFTITAKIAGKHVNVYSCNINNVSVT